MAATSWTPRRLARFSSTMPEEDDEGCSYLVGMISLTVVTTVSEPQTDPFTGLPWSMALRAWAGIAMKRGHEVTIILVDLDDFGLVNKTLGYVAGDALLRAVAYLLSGLVDASTDMLCRYRGDEFAIATTRRDAEVKTLTHRVRETVSLSLRMRGARTRLTASLGLAGGHRVERRTPLHTASTIEDLLALASRAATEAKASRRGVVYHGKGAVKEAPSRNNRPQNPPEARLRLLRATIRDDAPETTASVELGLGTRSAVGTASGHVRGKALPFLLAEATLQAIPQLIGQEYTFILEDLVEVISEDRRLVVVVLSDGRTKSERSVGTACATDTEKTTPQAILDALNRRLARIAAQVLGWRNSPTDDIPFRS